MKNERELFLKEFEGMRTYVELQARRLAQLQHTIEMVELLANDDTVPNDILLVRMKGYIHQRRFYLKSVHGTIMPTQESSAWKKLVETLENGG